MAASVETSSIFWAALNLHDPDGLAIFCNLDVRTTGGVNALDFLLCGIRYVIRSRFEEVWVVPNVDILAVGKEPMSGCKSKKPDR